MTLPEHIGLCWPTAVQKRPSSTRSSSSEISVVVLLQSRRLTKLKEMGPAATDSAPRKRFRRDELDEEEKMEIVEDDDDYEEYVVADGASSERVIALLPSVLSGVLPPPPPPPPRQNLLAMMQPLEHTDVAHLPVMAGISPCTSGNRCRQRRTSQGWGRCA